MVSGMLSGVLDVLSQDIAIDLGTSTTRIARRGRGVVLHEPSAVALHRDSQGQKRMIAVGSEARRMLGRTPSDIEVVRPVREGVIADFEVAEAMLRAFIAEASSGQLVRPKALLCIPAGTTEVERRALRECAESAGAREVSLTEQPLAGAIGAGLDVREAQGNLLVDLGGGITTVAVIALGDVVSSRMLRVGGDELDEAIVRYLRAQRGLLIGPGTAEELKRKVGAAEPGLRTGEGRAPSAEVRGRDLSSGWPRAIEINSDELAEAMAQPLRQIREAVLGALERTPPELAGDIAERGVVLIGGGALMPGMDRAISRALGVPVVAAERPLHAVVEGALSIG